MPQNCSTIHRIALALSLAIVGSTNAPAASLSPGLQLALDTRATQMGVDRSGHLWAWHAGNGSVWLIDAEQGLLAEASAPDAGSLDADREWGIAALSGDGNTLSLLTWEGQVTRRIPLPDQGGDVCWVAAATVAISPVMAGHRVELWDVAQGFQIATFGSEQPIRPRPGATRLRFVRLQFDVQRQQLYTLDTFTGSLQVFTLDGKMVRESLLPPARRESMEQWLEQVDQEYKARNEVFTPNLHLWADFRVDPEGTTWVISACDYEAGGAALLSLNPSGDSHEISATTGACCSRKFVLWAGQSLYYREPTLPKPPCNGVGTLPNSGGVQ